MDFVMTGTAKAHQIASLVCSALGYRHLVMHLIHGNQYPMLKALFTERMLPDIAVTDAFPRSAILAAY